MSDIQTEVLGANHGLATCFSDSVSVILRINCFWVGQGQVHTACCLDSKSWMFVQHNAPKVNINLTISFYFSCAKQDDYPRETRKPCKLLLSFSCFEDFEMIYESVL